MVGYFVPNKWLETQVWQSCDKRSTQIVNVALRNAWQMSPLEHGVQCIVNTAAMNRLFIAQGRKHSRPFTDQAMLEYSANQMAGNVNERNAEPKCTSEDIEAAGKKLKIYDCDMVLPFGTFHASMLQFQHRELIYYIRVQNASNTPFHKEPKEAVRSIAKDLVVNNQ